VTERTGRLSIFGVDDLPETRPGDDLVGQIAGALRSSGETLEADDVVVVTHKIVSKAEGRLVDLRLVEPSPFAVHLASLAGKDARQIEVVLRESVRIVKRIASIVS